MGRERGNCCADVPTEGVLQAVATLPSSQKQPGKTTWTADYINILATILKNSPKKNGS